MKSYNILIMSCDKNIDVLNLLLDQLKENWDNLDKKIYVGMEKKADINSTIVHKVINSEELNWGKRFKDALNEIPEDYVLLILDDYIVEKKVDNIRIDEILAYMENNNVANASFSVIRTDNLFQKISLFGFEQRYSKGKYLLNLQAGLWNKKVLLSLLKDCDTPWTAEYYGSIRARRITNKYKFISQVKGIEGPYVYNNGFLIIQGYLNLEEKERLENKISKKIILNENRISIKKPVELKRKSILKSIKIKIDLLIKHIEFKIGKDI